VSDIPDEVAASAPLHLRLRSPLEKATEKLALRAALTAAHLLGLATGRLLRELRAANDPLAEAMAQLKEADLWARLAWSIVDILGFRLDKIPDRQRPHFTPAQRFQILEIKSLLGWNRDLAARLFRVCPNTISNWERQADPVNETVGSTVKAVPPVVRIADVGRRLVKTMVQLGMGGEDMVAQILARAGWTISARSVRRIVREPGPSPTHPAPGRKGGPVIARFVNHVWMMDVSVVQTFLGGDLYIGAVFDAFSRAPLALSTYERTPGASAMARLLKSAARRFGSPKYLLTDQGREFTGKVFKKSASRLGIVQRFGSVQNIFATARIERFWRTPKQASSLRFQPPLTLADLERRLEISLTHYVCFRPHQGLAGASPAEALLGLEPRAQKAVRPPRGKAGEGTIAPPFVIDFLDRESRSFPFLKAA
jgi:transposase InsO family protein